MTELFKNYWKYILAGLAAPVLVLLIKDKLKAQTMNDNPHSNLKAFLAMIQYSEGTYGKNAYRTLYGGSLINDYGWHPNIAITRGGITSTAAGAYQILYGTWTDVAASLGLKDFSPLSQDRAAIELIKRRGALEDVLAGRFDTAIDKCKKEWASFPGAGYGQGERSIEILAAVYQKAGGQMAA